MHMSAVKVLGLREPGHSSKDTQATGGCTTTTWFQAKWTALAFI